jgi:integrase
VESGLVLTTGIGTPLDQRNMLRDFYRLVKVAGIPKIRFHDLRHSAVTLLLAQGVHMKAVQEILGHSSFNTTAKRLRARPTINETRFLRQWLPAETTRKQ